MKEGQRAPSQAPKFNLDTLKYHYFPANLAQPVVIPMTVIEFSENVLPLTVFPDTFICSKD